MPAGPRGEGLGRSERDFAIDVLQLLSSNFAQLREDTARAAPRDVDCSTFREVFGGFICNRRGYDGSALAADTDDLDRRLLQLYNNIDCRGKGRVTWDDIMTFLIDTTMLGRASDYTELMKGYSYVGSSALNDDGPHTCRPSLCKGRYLMVGPACETVDFSNFKPGEPLQASLRFKSTGEKVASLCAEYLSDFHLVVVSCTDLTLRVYETWRSCKQRRLLRTPESCLSLRYAAKSGVLFTGARSGAIRALQASSFVKDSSSEPAVVFSVTPHSDGVTEILSLGDGCIVSSSLDGTVAICNDVGQILFVLTKRGGPGITRMALLQVGDDGTQFVVTCGFETEARMWLVQHTVSIPFTLRDPMSPHVAPVVDVAASQAVPHVITLDASGVMKVWNARNWQPTQTIKCDSLPAPRHAKRWHSICYDDETKRLVALSNTTSALFDYGASVTPEKTTADDFPITAICHDCVRGVLTTASNTTVKTWDVYTGKLLMLHENAVSNTISALAASETGRRLYIGTTEGQVTQHNSSSGVLLATISSEGAEVHSIVYGTGRWFIIVLRWDNTVQTYSDSGSDGVVQGSLNIDPRCFNPYEARSVAFSDVLNRIAVGDRAGFITIWEAKVRRNDEFNALTQLKPGAGMVDIVLLQFLTGVPCLVSIDANGCLVVWSLPPHPKAFEIIAQHCLGTERRAPTSLGWYWPKSMLYVGCSDGTLLAFSLHRLLQRHRMHAFYPSLSDLEAAFPESGTGGAQQAPPPPPPPPHLETAPGHTPRKRGSIRYNALYLEAAAAVPHTPRGGEGGTLGDVEAPGGGGGMQAPLLLTPRGLYDTWGGADGRRGSECGEGPEARGEEEPEAEAEGGDGLDPGGIDEVSSRDAHVGPITFMSVDPVNRFIVTVSERSLKLWGIGLHCIGGFDQSQKQTYSIPPNYESACSAQGDPVLQFRHISHEERTHPDAIIRFAEHANPSDDPSTAPPASTALTGRKAVGAQGGLRSCAPEVYIPDLSPVAPLPGSGWMGGAAQPKSRAFVSFEDSIRRASAGRDESARHAWYSALGMSSLVLKKPSSTQEGAGVKLTQQSFRTLQCNDHLARIRDIRILDEAVPFEPRAGDTTVTALNLPEDFSPDTSRGLTVARKSRLMSRLGSMCAVSATDAIPLKKPFREKLNQRRLKSPAEQAMQPVHTPLGEFHHYTSFDPVCEPFSAVASGPPNRPIREGTDLLQVMNEKRGVTRRPFWQQKSRILKPALQHRELRPNAGHRGTDTVAALSKRRTQERLAVAEAATAPPPPPPPPPPAPPAGAAEPSSPLEPLPQVVAAGRRVHHAPTNYRIVCPAEDGGAQQLPLEGGKEEPDCRQGRTDCNIDAFRDTAHSLASHSLAPDFAERVRSLSCFVDVQPPPGGMSPPISPGASPTGNPRAKAAPLMPWHAVTQSGVSCLSPDVRPLCTTTTTTTTTTTQQRAQTPVPTGGPMPVMMVDWYCGATAGGGGGGGGSGGGGGVVSLPVSRSATPDSAASSRQRSRRRPPLRGRGVVGVHPEQAPFKMLGIRGIDVAPAPLQPHSAVLAELRRTPLGMPLA